MKLTLSFAELHTPLFLGGKNFGLKLDSLKFGGILLIYDRTEKELWVNHNQKTAIIPVSNVVSMTPADTLMWDAISKGTPESFFQANKEPVAGHYVTDKQPLSNLGPVHTESKANRNSEVAPGLSKAQVSTPTSHVFAKGEGKK